jgi:hypothetical protein
MVSIIYVVGIFVVFNDLWSEVAVWFVDIGGIVDSHFLNFLFLKVSGCHYNIIYNNTWTKHDVTQILLKVALNTINFVITLILKRRAIILQICLLNLYLLCFSSFFATIYQVFWFWIRTKIMVFGDYLCVLRFPPPIKLTSTI